MIQKKSKIQIPHFYMCILLFWYSTELLIKTTLGNFLGVPIGTLNMIQSYLVFLLLLVQIVCFQQYSSRELMRMALFLSLVIIATIQSGYNNSLLSFTLFTFASKDQDFNKIIRMIYHISLVLVPLIVISYLLGYIENFVIYRNGIVPRLSLGLDHPNTLGQYIFNIMACHFYLRFKKLKWWDYLLAFGATFFCYVVPNSQTSTVLLILMVVLILMDKVARKVQRERVFMYTLTIGAFACNVGSIILSSIDLTHYPWLSLLDTTISKRFSACHRVIELYGIKWFGQKITILTAIDRRNLGITKGAVFLDNSYCAILLIYGIIIFAVFSVMYLCNMNIHLRKQRSNLVIFLFLIAVYGVMERTLFKLSINIFLLSFAELFYGSSKRKNLFKLSVNKPKNNVKNCSSDLRISRPGTTRNTLCKNR